ncbi:GtrA family protein [Bhargavaea beijingensis]|uniref:GtrA family protein n=1 Tax=Bhargavaea beijingensis TaxID=426756 RepID=UPI0022240AC7|nr:GtrA family protein [Bhargavaea beijingensis]MCW1928845.1 GtrA family protein [Bhargavaea beijingensis]
MINLFEKIKDNQFLRFLIVGGINTVNYYLLYLLFLHPLSFSYLISHILAFFISFIVSYFLNCYFVYRVRPTWSKLFKFPLTQIFNMSIQTFIIFLVVDFWGLSATVAPLLAVVVTVPFTYWVTKIVLVDKK